MPVAGKQTTEVLDVPGMALVDSVLAEAVASEVSLLSQASLHLIQAGGKRIRPRIVLLAYQAAGGGEDIAQVAPLAAAVELLHTASLIHDDINDRSDMRRGRPSVNARFGDGLALLIGDFTFIKFLGLLPGFSPRIIELLAKASTAIIEGEMRQTLSVGDATFSQEDYIDVIRQKTGVLFAACGALGAIQADASEKDIAAFSDFALNLGMAFQIRDDTLDLLGQADELGKPVASDLQQGKASLATIYAARKLAASGAQDAAAARDLAVLHDGGDPEQVLDVLRRTGALDFATDTCRSYVIAAQEALDGMGDSEAKVALLRLAELAADRSS